GLVGVNFNHTEWLLFMPELIATFYLVAFLWGSFEFYRTFFSFKNNVPETLYTT
ncbi:MAG: hypothetical protein ACI9UR_002454, partial [Bacteroidia bacterium]